MKLEGRTAVITGASRGLGAGLARTFRARGLRLALCARSHFAEDWADAEDVYVESLDVCDAGAVARFTERAAERLGAIDLWVNNAGILEPIGPLSGLDLAAFRLNLEINVFGVAVGSQAYVRHLRAGGRSGVLINVSSGAGRRAYAGWSAYCASKAAVDRLTECIHEEEAASGLRAYSVAPGVIDTAMQAQIRACSQELFPEVERFWELKRNDGFSQPAFVAERMLELAFGGAAEDQGAAAGGVLQRFPSQPRDP